MCEAASRNLHSSTIAQYVIVHYLHHVRPEGRAAWRCRFVIKTTRGGDECRKLGRNYVNCVADATLASEN